MTDTVPRPDFSPDMLSGFLRARVAMLARVGRHPQTVITPAMLAVERTGIRRGARLSAKAFNAAWKGMARDAETRARLWGFFGIVPAEHGWLLDDSGGQERIAP